MKNIYDLKLHEELITDSLRIVRVAGGWIYCLKTVHEFKSTVFVPFNEEFKIFPECDLEMSQNEQLINDKWVEKNFSNLEL